MLNTYTSTNKQTFEFHSVSGIMCKSHKKSIICKTGKNPYLLDMDKPRTYANEYIKHCKEVVVLQCMILEDGFLIEYIPKDIYEGKEND